MEHIKQKMERARQQRKRLEENPHANTDDFTIIHDSTSNLENFIRYFTFSHDASLLLVGAAAGAVVIAIVWWMNLAGMDGGPRITSLNKAEVIQARNTAVLQSDTSDFKKSIDDIAHLNERVESLNNTIVNLEVNLMRVLVLADSITDIDGKLITAAQHYKPANDETESVFDTMEPTASGMVHATSEVEGGFTPTHTVKAKLNLRPSASLNTTPVTVLKTGAQVEYISEVDGWYYVNTKSSQKWLVLF